jgi:type V secretory pathway adhesin AidA
MTLVVMPTRTDSSSINGLTPASQDPVRPTADPAAAAAAEPAAAAATGSDDDPAGA